MRFSASQRRGFSSAFAPVVLTSPGSARQQDRQPVPVLVLVLMSKPLPERHLELERQSVPGSP
jgi:hypothetical protein